MRARTTALSALATTMVVCAGCQALVLDGVGGGGGGSDVSTVDGTTGTGTVTGSGAGAIAIRYGDLPPGSGVDASFLPTPPDPDALVLVFSNQPISCSNLVPSFSIPPDPCDGSDMWATVIVVPPVLDHQGEIDLQDERIAETAEEALPGCNGGGERQTPGGSGQLVIGSGDTSTLNVTLQGGVMAMSTVIDGSYAAQWCSTPPTPPAPAPAVAIPGASLPPGALGAPGVGTSPDPTATYVFLGTGMQTCASPVADVCPGAAQLTFKLPAGTTSGTFDLTDPQVEAWYSYDGSLGQMGANCNDMIGQVTSGMGTVQVLSADATSLSLRVYGSYNAGLVFDVDGLYTASICSP
jgi:hypothetical protein